MISFDVISPYTNVPVIAAMDEAAEHLFSGEFAQPPVDKQTLMTVSQLAVTNIILSTHDGWYKQIDGLAMGSQPAPYLENIWLPKFEPTVEDDATLLNVIWTTYYDQ